MKDTLTDANFPRTADGRVYHLGIRAGEVANRIITVGPPARARSIASLLSPEPAPFVLESDRGFLTITGLFNGVPVSICAIGMGASNADFFVREVRECITRDMVVVRLGSCGGLLSTLPVGSIVVPKASVAVSRNYDFDFTNSDTQSEEPYHISKPVSADLELHDSIVRSLQGFIPEGLNILVKGDIVNASADSFYSSQGRQTSFPDNNEHLIDRMLQRVDSLGSLEMETFHILHLAKSWSDSSSGSRPGIPAIEEPAPSDPPVPHLPSSTHVSNEPERLPTPEQKYAKHSRIRAVSVQMVFAARLSRDFITPEVVRETEVWSGKAVLTALSEFPIPEEKLHPSKGSVWAV
ncbi:hypothetical protein M422DRAFT_52594 [Sphaerobolus stellatus SS14]|uniref:Nucleoside phosphorylase domain-containing protein n=1 Tax=Sphaerobolus stellatus (strain SS14) TaxID=990650 RepID=A0A0C9TS30_SPHS4|nr:hypothetical protein M422DRAFT_52594 [Sphaerobolus stellatus SS14]